MVGSKPPQPTKLCYDADFGRHNMNFSERALSLYPEYQRVYGPYHRNSDNRMMVVFQGQDSKTTRQYAKVILEIKLGRRLVGDETVDHIDDDFTNDDPSNLQVLTLEENAKKYHSNIEKYPSGWKQTDEMKKSGEKNGMSKLTNSEVEYFRREFSDGRMSKSDIIAASGMSRKGVENFLYGRSYKNAKNAVK